MKGLLSWNPRQKAQLATGGWKPSGTKSALPVTPVLAPVSPSDLAPSSPSQGALLAMAERGHPPPTLWHNCIAPFPQLTGTSLFSWEWILNGENETNLLSPKGYPWKAEPSVEAGGVVPVDWEFDLNSQSKQLRKGEGWHHRYYCPFQKAKCWEGAYEAYEPPRYK